MDKNPHGAMNPTDNIIRDARVFGIITVTETCAEQQIVFDCYFR
jgi:hypothetical protein